MPALAIKSLVDGKISLMENKLSAAFTQVCRSFTEVQVAIPHRKDTPSPAFRILLMCKSTGNEST